MHPTFTHDLTNAIDEVLAPTIRSRIVAMNPNDVLSYSYPRKVGFQITQDNLHEYLRVADALNETDDIKAVSIQHEFGIYGGQRGNHLVPFIKALQKPAVITFHTVVPDPDAETRAVVRSLAEASSFVIVMTRRSRQILTQDYGISPRKLRVIPHGIHSRPYKSSANAKTALGFSDRVVLSTFGLLNSGKGLEYVIEALPQVVREFPDFVYIYFGATHPVVLRDEGETYRNMLIQKVYKLGLFDHVKFYNRYFPLSELLRFLSATDIYVSPGLEPNQAVSGTLSYALGSGRPVVSTAFAQARELVTEDVGILVDFRNPQAYAEAILQLVLDEEMRTQMGRNAYFRTRNMTWPNVALKYIGVFSECAEELAATSVEKSLPKVKLDHLIRLTDNFGIVQFARLTRPDRASGYTLDDNARALVAAVTCFSRLALPAKSPQVAKQRNDLLKIIGTYLDFCEFVAGPDGYFRNFVRGDRTLDQRLNEEANLEEANARAIYALALTATTGSLPRTACRRAYALLERRMREPISFESPRAVSLCIKALSILLEKRTRMGATDTEYLLRAHCDRLMALYETVSTPEWQWFEPYLTYSNAMLSEALFQGYLRTSEESYLEVGKATLDFLIRRCFTDGVFVPVGEEGWHQKDGKSHHYDQQPEEVKAMVYALRACHAATGSDEYRRLMYRAFSWFLGDNTLDQVVYDRITGGCYDGVGKKSVNLNEGAESTISYLLARLAFE